MTNLQPAKAVKVFRNSGEVAPITVQFVQEKVSTSSNKHSSIISRGLGRSNTTRQYLLYNCTEEVFNEDFAEFKMSSDDITGGYSEAVEIDLTTEEIFGEPVYISRTETTDESIVRDEKGELKPGWSVKRVNGQELTNEGAIIYSTHIFSEDGVDHKLAHDQNLSTNPVSSSTKAEAKAEANVDAIKETAPAKAKKEVKAEVEEEENEEVSFDF